MRVSLLLCAALLVAACGSPVTATADGGGADAGATQDAGLLPDAGDADAGADAGAPDAGTMDAGTPDAGAPDAGASDAGTPDAGMTDAGPVDAGTWLTSLHVCWNDPSCPRALAVAHGGVWNTGSRPYDSNAALNEAIAQGLDAVKIDVRVTADDVPVISHSSPIEYFESLDCMGRVIETSNASDVTACHRFPSTTEKFQKLEDVLDALRGKIMVQLCVKRAQDYQRTVDAVKALNAQDFAFIEVNAGDMTTSVAALTNASDIFFLVNLASDTGQVAPLLALNDPRAIMFEFDPGVDVSSITPNQLHPAGVRAFTYDDAPLLTVQQARTHFESGYDVVSANRAVETRDARVQVNTARGVTPP